MSLTDEALRWLATIDGLAGTQGATGVQGEKNAAVRSGLVSFLAMVEKQLAAAGQSAPQHFAVWLTTTFIHGHLAGEKWASAKLTEAITGTKCTPKQAMAVYMAMENGEITAAEAMDAMAAMDGDPV